MDEDVVEDDDVEEGDHAVPSDLLELHMELEEKGITAEQFNKEMNV